MVLLRPAGHPAQPAGRAPGRGTYLRGHDGRAAGVVPAAQRGRRSALRFGLLQQLIRVDAERAGDDYELGDVDVTGPAS